jgi:hypothetical protein
VTCQDELKKAKEKEKKKLVFVLEKKGLAKIPGARNSRRKREEGEGGGSGGGGGEERHATGLGLESRQSTNDHDL